MMMTTGYYVCIPLFRFLQLQLVNLIMLGLFLVLGFNFHNFKNLKIKHDGIHFTRNVHRTHGKHTHIVVEQQGLTLRQYWHWHFKYLLNVEMSIVGWWVVCTYLGAGKKSTQGNSCYSILCFVIFVCETMTQKNIMFYGLFCCCIIEFCTSFW